MKISTMIPYAGGFKQAVQQVADLEKAGLDLVWVPEAYGFDGVSLMGYLAAKTERVEIGSAITPIYTRTPTLIGMTAAGLDHLTEGRYHLGLGASGPQVIEGFHGVPYDAPLGRTREIIDICRKVWAREAPLTHEGRYYQMPLPADQGTGLGKALKIIAHPDRKDIPVWIASLGEKNVELTAEVATGWIPILFIPEKVNDVWGASIAAGKAKRDASLGELQITAGGLLAIADGEDVRNVAEASRHMAALYIGGMGAKGKNFYNTVCQRYGYEREAEQIQDLYLSGKKQEAAAAVPQEMVDLMNLCGPRSLVEERVAAFKAAGVTHLQVHPVGVGDRSDVQQVETLREILG